MSLFLSWLEFSKSWNSLLGTNHTSYGEIATDFFYLFNFLETMPYFNCYEYEFPWLPWVLTWSAFTQLLHQRWPWCIDQFWIVLWVLAYRRVVEVMCGVFFCLSFMLKGGVGGRVYTLQIRSGLAHACLTVGNPTVSDSWPTFLEEHDGAAASYPGGATRRRVEGWRNPPPLLCQDKEKDRFYEDSRKTSKRFRNNNTSTWCSYVKNNDLRPSFIL